MIWDWDMHHGNGTQSIFYDDPAVLVVDSHCAAQFDHMMNHESGLLGLSETSSEIRDLLACEAVDPRAAQAIDLFCYQAKKNDRRLCRGTQWSGYAGLYRRHRRERAGHPGRICDGLDFFGITLDPVHNAAGAALISYDSARVAVRVIATDEEQMIATLVARVTDTTCPY